MNKNSLIVTLIVSITLTLLAVKVGYIAYNFSYIGGNLGGLLPFLILSLAVPVTAGLTVCTSIVLYELNKGEYL